MQLIEHYEVPSGGVSSITFMNVGDIPSDYTDLMIVYSLRSSNRADFGIKFNNSTSNFSNRYLFGTGSSASSSTGYGNFLGTMTGSGETANTFGSGQLYIPNYRSSFNKSYSIDAVQENNATTSYQSIIAGLWSVTNPITSISLYQQQGDTIVQYSSASLYGILAGSDGTTTVS